MPVKLKTPVARAKRGHFARQSNNFLKWHVPPDDVATATDLRAHDAFLYEAQRLGSPHIEFSSMYDMLRFLGMTDKGQNYRALNHALTYLRKLEFDIPDWKRTLQDGETTYDPDNHEDVETFRDRYDLSSNREARQAIPHYNRKLRVRSIRVKCLLGVRRYLDGRIAVVFNKRYYKLNAPRKNYVPLYLDDTSRLRSAQQIRLLRLVRSFPPSGMLRDGVVPIRKETLMRRLGMYDSNSRRWRAKLLAMARALSERTSVTLDVSWQPGAAVMFLKPSLKR